MLWRSLAFQWSCALLAANLAAGCLFAADWSEFRGPNGNGVADVKSAPTKWGPQEHVLWKAELPAPGNGSPIFSQGKVFVTSSENAEGTQRSLICFDAQDGKQLWKQTVAYKEKMPTHETNPYCGTTPAANGERIVVWHASAGLYCYDMAGNEIWHRDFGEFRHIWGYGTSPIIRGDKVILFSGPGKKVFVTALELGDGKTIWEQQEPVEGDGQKNDEGKYLGSWSTPIVHQAGDHQEVILMLPTRVNAYELETGEIQWTCNGLRHDRGDLAYSSPIIVGDICFVTGGFKGPTIGIKLGGQGDVTETNRLYRLEESPQSIGSGVAVNGYVYRPNAGPETIECIDPKTGEVLWKTRAAGGNFWGSIVQVNGLLYATDQGGNTTIFKPNPEKFEEVATNELKAHTNATPAVAEGKLFFRTDKHLICVGE